MCKSVPLRIAAYMTIAVTWAGGAAPAHAAAAAANAAADTSFSADFVKTGLPLQQRVADTIPITGKLALDKRQTRIAAARVAGRLGRIFVFEGQSVHAGEPLAEIYSPDFISAENEFLLAKRFRDTLAADGSDAELRSDADITLRSAANKLKVLGAAPADIATLERRATIAEYLMVRAPISGVVTQRNVDPGGYLNVGDALMSLANLDTLWLFANTYDADYQYLKLGQLLAFETPSLPGERFSGQIAFIAPSIDPNTHTLPIRCDVPNRDFRLRPEMFVRGDLKVGERMALIVPKSAVIHIRDSDYVIVLDGKQFRRVPVRGHAIEANRYAITAGLSAQVPVVTDGTLLLNEMTGEE
ncbi:MAG TPA: efflux RND transporter periplasmic adaptor subunit [Steroidobacteraceae bacterium]|jgi:Cu(I)/Ag(I) efflux system membrane fusion protein|nr:efflux RND transporter periplasmic adaptor subunit [Steroidobacteraceae bacterium]